MALGIADWDLSEPREFNILENDEREEDDMKEVRLLTQGEGCQQSLSCLAQPRSLRTGFLLSVQGFRRGGG